MHRYPRAATAALAAALAALAGTALTAAPAHATTGPVARIIVSPNGDHESRAAGRHVTTIAEAQQLARTLSGKADVIVSLAGGTYRLTEPWKLTAADSGSNGHSVTWQALPGQHPVISGGRQVTGWTVKDAANNIYAASVPAGADSRQLYVDGALAPRAAITISRSDVKITPSGMTVVNPALDYLATLPEQSRIEVESQDSFTDRYAPVQSISGTTVTMQQPAWNNNNWGYDTLASPFAGGSLQLENSYAFLKTAGQWYLDPQAGQLYYKAPAGWTPTAHDIELPQLTSLLQVSGTYANPVRNITFQGIAFEHSTWLVPGTSIGYADQQNGAFIPSPYPQPADFITSCRSGCQQFEATRSGWDQIPAAVQVSAASGITFSGDTFAHLGQVGLGIGNDANAHASGTGLGTSDITVYHNTFTDDSGAGIVAGGIQADAHHPSDPAMVNKDITISDNLVTKVAEDYKEMSGILSTYVTHAVITHNEVSDLAYDGIDVGWGWGFNDPGGSQDYRNRGLYNYQPVYTTPTTLKDTVVSHNLIHGTKKVFHDGGSLYNLSANPGAVFDSNYIYDNQHTVGLYLDEGSRYVTMSHNVVQDSGVFAFTNASSTNNTDDNTFDTNWYNGGATQVATGAPHNNVLTGNVQVGGTNWPLAAQQVIYEAGIEPALRTAADSRPAPAGAELTAAKSSVGSGGTTTLTGTVQNFSTRDITGLTLGLDLPAGWTASPAARPNPTVPAGGTATVSWLVTAPATVPDPLTSGAFTLNAAYRGGRSAYTATSSARVSVAGAVTTLRSFGSVPSVFGQAGDRYAILTGGNDIWGAGGQHFDEYGALYSPKAAADTATITVEVTAQQAVDPWSKAGLVLRDDLTAPGSAQGYAVLVVTPGNGVSFQWQDAATPGYLDQFSSSVDKSVKAPVWLRLKRSGSQVSGYYSTDGSTWMQVGSAITLTGATSAEDAGMIATAHSPSAQGEADFSGFNVA
ncbi:NEW3 domain-containing protein [Actinacidiphila acididurans]|uniref:Right-handed parallel beta-helix repeat-containing protein n=1 Tax=Actinacidiphila acididurans TaxID=2784346 RepID=A0ABS2TKJ6_9ACTN|nr:NEW3 domain-containing protein [Actinacidiphila acididurans]MBM9503021.1 right-handed parallel beta-helix repeat-containing protein [Actinacidiphila acididurans]